MAYSKVWYHAGAPCNGCGGIGDMWRALHTAGIPFAVYSVEGGGLIAEAAAYPGATLIYRMLRTDVAAYELSPENAAARTWDTTLQYLPPEVHTLRGRVWLEIGNEQDKNRADWLGHYYAELAELSALNGWRICGPGWSTGEPEPNHWETPGWLRYLRLCAAEPDRLGVTVHEYSLDADDVMAGSPWLVGRVKFLMDACAAHAIRPPTVFVTEAGWTHNDLPHADKAKEDIAALAALYAGYPTVRGAFLWTLIGGGDKRTLAAELNALMPWLTQYAIDTRFPDVEEPPPGDGNGEEPVTNVLINPSFEDGWTDHDVYTTTQNPTGWTVEWNVGPLYNNPHSEWEYLLGEGVHKSKAMLPAAERDVFVWDGEWTYKLFAGQRSFWARLKQTLTLPAGRYQLTTPVWVDCYRWAGFKDYNVEPWQAETMVKAGGRTVKEWALMVSGTKAAPVTVFDHAGGPVDLAVHFRCNWPISNNLWLDGWSLIAVTETPPPVDPPPPAKHKAIVLKVPQNVTAAEWLEAAEFGYQYRHTMTASHDDMLTILRGGNDQSYVKLAYPERQQDVAALIEAAGYTWTPVLADPLAGVEFGHPFAWRYVTTSGFNTARSYGPHEGVDYDIVGGAANNTVGVLCVYPGIVERSSDSTTGYGKQVRVRHVTPSGVLFYTRYAHLDARYVEVGQALARGEAVGEVGATGNANGEHLHLNIEIPGYGLPGYVTADVIDPTEYIPTGADLPLYSTALVDLLPYLRGDGRLYEVRHPSGQTETFQTQSAGPVFYQVKNGAWEELYADGEYIWRGRDTSPGGGRFYVQYEPGLSRARWMPRYMATGQTWIGPGHFVQFYDKATCQPSAANSGNATNRMTFLRRHAARTWNGITVEDVVELTNGTEIWFYARGYGLVAWSAGWGASAITQVYAPGERGDLTREVLNCS